MLDTCTHTRLFTLLLGLCLQQSEADSTGGLPPIGNLSLGKANMVAGQTQVRGPQGRYTSVPGRGQMPSAHAGRPNTQGSHTHAGHADAESMVSRMPCTGVRRAHRAGCACQCACTATATGTGTGTGTGTSPPPDLPTRAGVGGWLRAHVHARACSAINSSLAFLLPRSMRVLKRTRGAVTAHQPARPGICFRDTQCGCLCQRPALAPLGPRACSSWFVQ